MTHQDFNTHDKGLPLRTSLGLLLAGWGLSMALSPLLTSSFIPDTYYRTVLGMIMMELIFLAPVLWYVRRKKGEYSLIHLFNLSTPDKGSWPGVISFMAGLLILADAADRLLMRWMDIPPEYFSLLEGMKWSEPAEAILMIITVSGVAAFVEEVIFRGMLLGSMEKAFRNPKTSIIISSLFFALVHALPWYFVHIFLLGIILGALSSGLRSVWPAVFCHGTYNLVSIILLNLDHEPLWYVAEGRVRNVWVLIAGLLLWLGIFLLKPYFRLPAYPLPQDAEKE
ncbi:MAG: protease family protein [Candidatus Marinimicrobia bacterium]|jgi:membrane protease YdiL (CAAX protease family)|nr:protease family protein [Candidatus Neomarinimicrobiota bacterium]